MPAYLLEPAAPSATVPDYSGAITNITSELNDIDTDTTSMAAQILLIAASLATMASNSTSIKNSLTTIENSVNSGSTNLLSVLSDIQGYQQRLKDLGETTGIRIRSPYETFGMVSIYKLLIEEGKILELDKVSDAKRDEAYRTLQYYFDQINKVVPKEF